MIRKGCRLLAASSKNTFNPYDVLGVNPSASKEEIKRAYHRMALRYHPDSGAGGGNVEKFNAVQEAYELLKQGKPWHSSQNMHGNNENTSRSYSSPYYTYDTPGTTDKGYVSGSTEIYLRAFMISCFVYIFIVFFFKSRRAAELVEEEVSLSVHEEG